MQQQIFRRQDARLGIADGRWQRTRPQTVDVYRKRPAYSIEAPVHVTIDSRSTGKSLVERQVVMAAVIPILAGAVTVVERVPRLLEQRFNRWKIVRRFDRSVSPS